MKNLIIVFILSLLGYSSEAQNNNLTSSTLSHQSKVVIEHGMLISFEGIDLSHHELEVEDFDVTEVTIDILLCLATNECDEALVIELLDRGADVNFKCEEVDDVITNLAFCKENGVQLAELLLSKGASINGADEDNESFLSYAISCDNLKLTAFLIENGADQMHRDTNRNMGCLPVHGVKSIEMLELLISKGFEINLLCDNGRNLLHFAAKNDLRAVAQYLIDKQLVDVNQKDVNGETPLDYAVKFNHREIAKMIGKQ